MISSSFKHIGIFSASGLDLGVSDADCSFCISLVFLPNKIIFLYTVYYCSLGGNSGLVFQVGSEAQRAISQAKTRTYSDMLNVSFPEAEPSCNFIASGILIKVA